MGYNQRKLQGCSPETASKIVDLLFQESPDHLDLVKKMSPSRSSHAVAELWAKHVKPSGPKIKEYTRVRKHQRPRLTDEQVQMIRDAMESTGLRVAQWCHRYFPKRYYIVYGLHEDPNLRGTISGWVMKAMLDLLKLDHSLFPGLTEDDKAHWNKGRILAY